MHTKIRFLLVVGLISSAILYQGCATNSLGKNSNFSKLRMGDARMNGQSGEDNLNDTMTIYLYRWRIKPDKIEQFEKSWTFITKQCLAQGSLGSRLHLGNDGLYYAYAQWPNRKARDQVEINEEMKKFRAEMADAIQESYPAVILNPVTDLLLTPITESSSHNVPALNQVTLGSQNLDESISFYKKLGLQLIVKNDHYARFLSPSGTTLSLELVKAASIAGPTAVYFEHPRLDDWVLNLKQNGLVFENEAENKNWLWREAWLRDPYGNRICLFYAGRNRKFPPWRITDS